MGVLDVNTESGIVRVSNSAQMMGMFLTQLAMKTEALEKALRDEPSQFERIEREVKELFNQGAGLFTAGLLAAVMKSDEHKQRGDEVRSEYAIALRNGQDRKVQIRFGSGFTCSATTRYCQPAQSATDGQNPVPGIDVELSLFGFSDGRSPGLISKVVRGAALCSSLELAREELLRDGIEIGQEEHRSIVYQYGRRLLTLRQRQLEQFERGEMVAGTEMGGKKVSIQIDGGRTRTRSDMSAIDPIENLGKTQSEATGRESQGRSKESKRKGSFQTEWKEPKLFKIYVHDENGRVDKRFEERIDGSFSDADQIERLLAMRMYQLGVNQAESITFNSDGAKWIWDRIDSIVARAQVPSTVPIIKILDVYHASENLNKGIKALGELSSPSEVPQSASEYSTASAAIDEVLSFRPLRSELRNGLWQQVADKLQEGAKRCAQNPGHDSKEVTRVIEYLRSHGEAGHMDYPMFSIQGLPLGSGSIESAIRRVVNLRMKGNGVFWKLENAECMLTIRSSILSKRWDEDHASVNKVMLRNQQLAFPKQVRKRRPKSDAATVM